MTIEKKHLSVWLRLITNSTIIEKEIRNRFRVEFNVTLPRFDLMSALERAPDGLTMGELSKRLLVSGGNVTGVVERLHNEELVKRKALPTDKRIFSVALTVKGHEVFKQMAQAHEKWVHELFDGFSEEESDQMVGLLDKIRSNLKKEEELE